MYEEQVAAVKRLYNGLSDAAETASKFRSGEIVGAQKQNFDIVSNDGETILGVWLPLDKGGRELREFALSNGYDRRLPEKPIMKGTAQATYNALVSLLDDPSGKLAERIRKTERFIAELAAYAEKAAAQAAVFALLPRSEFCVMAFQGKHIQEINAEIDLAEWDVALTAACGLDRETIKQRAAVKLADIELYLEWRKAPPAAPRAFTNTDRLR